MGWLRSFLWQSAALLLLQVFLIEGLMGETCLDKPCSMAQKPFRSTKKKKKRIKTCLKGVLHNIWGTFYWLIFSADVTSRSWTLYRGAACMGLGRNRVRVSKHLSCSPEIQGWAVTAGGKATQSASAAMPHNHNAIITEEGNPTVAEKHFHQQQHPNHKAISRTAMSRIPWSSAPSIFPSF